ncbi:hypothetical protein ACF0H5_021195 [Mactra antiquata]
MDFELMALRSHRLSHPVEYNLEEFNLREDNTTYYNFTSSKVKQKLNFSQIITNDVINDVIQVKKKVKVQISHIGFLKVHKAGSSTMQNMFFRYGLRNNLTFVLPKTGHYVLSHNQALPVTNGSHRDILACHSMYRQSIFSKLLPADSVKIGIVREPLDRMISAAFYYRDVLRKRYLRKVPKKDFIENLINKSSIYDSDTFSRTKNSMGRDFGFSSHIKFEDTGLIKSQLAKLEKEFSLVLMVERFDESLVLMKRLLNWELSDIIYLKTNTHPHTHEKLNQGTVAKFKKINFLDQAVYDTFKDVFKSKVKDAGPSLQREVTVYRNILKMVKTFCDTASNKDRLLVPDSKWNDVFYVTYTACKLMSSDELPFVSALRSRHKAMHSVKQKA